MFDSLYHEIEIIERTHRVLLLVGEHGPIGIRRLSRTAEREHHEIRASLRLLEEEGYIESTPDGAVTTADAGNYLIEVADDIDAVTDSLDSLPTLPKEVTRAER
ncbi:hypothetical protein [Haladaptatus sp.]|uniref:hypothetical protein n=1 Tax=Haladaptatus sp. TaxID=1973141 RepID=UPI003C46A8B8